PAPSRINPVTSPQAAKDRRTYVLRRLLEKGHITQAEYEQAMAVAVEGAIHGLKIESESPDMAEMGRTELIQKFGEEIATTSGFRVYTALDSRLQELATAALRKALLDYDRRHGYRGPERHVDLPQQAGQAEWSAQLASFDSVGGLPPAIVVGV